MRGIDERHVLSVENEYACTHELTIYGFLGGVWGTCLINIMLNYWIHWSLHSSVSTGVRWYCALLFNHKIVHINILFQAPKKKLTKKERQRIEAEKAEILRIEQEKEKYAIN